MLDNKLADLERQLAVLVSEVHAKDEMHTKDGIHTKDGMHTIKIHTKTRTPSCTQQESYVPNPIYYKKRPALGGRTLL